MKRTAQAANSVKPLDSLCCEPTGESFTRGGITIFHGDALQFYDRWPPPVVIISDGAYGLGLFPGDPHTPDALAAWYEPHVEAWSPRSTPETTLWFWNSELGWATIHPVLLKHGWRYVNCHIWDKGLSHIAGNSNTKTLRKFPVVTEVCVQYVREVTIRGLTLRDWLRSEWERTRLPFSLTNAASETKNAATRKYFTRDHLWYFPPPDAFARLAEFANTHGNPAGRPYFSVDGKRPLTPEEWARMRAKFTCRAGITNVWREPPLGGSERVKLGTRSVHLNQKPLKLMEIVVEASSDANDVVWEPFGGLCTGALAAHNLKRQCVSAEIDRDFYELAVRRLQGAG
ncbi:MAG: site-specific DNA-methyltransferase [Chloroflexi bacterium]|nr:site-specific DNA-methyltransferase [Chloroflexota bacterium]